VCSKIEGEPKGELVEELEEVLMGEGVERQILHILGPLTCIC
jgi:hypothetical protein